MLPVSGGLCARLADRRSFAGAVLEVRAVVLGLVAVTPSVTAVHEAGHLVALDTVLPSWRRVRHPKVTSRPAVTIVGDAGRLGHTLGPPTALFAAPVMAGRRWVFVAYVLAGPVAEARHSHKRVAAVFASGGRVDYRTANDFCRLYGLDLVGCLAPAERLVAERWEEILAVAAALDERKSLTSADVAALVEAPGVTWRPSPRCGRGVPGTVWGPKGKS